MPIYFTILVYYIVIMGWQHFVNCRYISLYALVAAFYIFIVSHTLIKPKAVRIAYTTI